MTIALDEKQYLEDMKNAYQVGRSDGHGGWDTDYDFIYEGLKEYLPKQPDTSMHEMD